MNRSKTQAALARVTEEEKKARRSADEARTVLEFFEAKVLGATRPEGELGGLGRDVTVRRAVEAAEPQIADEFRDQPTAEAAIRNTLGVTYWSLGESAPAIRQYERGLRLFREAYGPEHPETCLLMENLGNAYATVGRIDEAITLLEEAVRLNQDRLGRDDPKTLISLNNLAGAYNTAGRPADALAILERSAGLLKAKLGPDHPHTLGNACNIAFIYIAVGRSADAASLLESALKLVEGKIPPRHTIVLITLNNLASAYLDIGRWAAAEATVRTCLERREQEDPDGWWKFQTMSQLGAALAGLGRHPEAEPLLVRGYEGLKTREAKMPSLRKRHLLEAGARIVPFYASWDKPEKAAEWRTRLATEKIEPKTQFSIEAIR